MAVQLTLGWSDNVIAMIDATYMKSLVTTISS